MPNSSKQNHTNKKFRKLVRDTVIAEVADIATTTLGRWRAEKRNLPYYTIGGAVRYDLDECISIIENNRVNIGVLEETNEEHR